MENELRNQLDKILLFISSTYKEKAMVKPDILNYPYNIFILTEKYDLKIKLEIPKENHYLYGKCQYILDFNYNANKKYRNELGWSGGGYSEKYNENDYSNISEFLNKYCIKKQNKQMTIFDYLDKEVK